MKKRDERTCSCFIKNHLGHKMEPHSLQHYLALSDETSAARTGVEKPLDGISARKEEAGEGFFPKRAGREGEPGGGKGRRGKKTG
ncbi:MAG: hypothetical protein ABSH25_05295 [Syntrophorhabdales bacterium]